MIRLGLGTVQFGMRYGIANASGQISYEEARSILALARANGIDTLDTAAVYGNSEAALGELGVADFKVVTKLPAVPNDVLNVGDWVGEQVHASLQRLRLPSVHGVLIHRVSDLFGRCGAQLALALNHVRAAGLADKVGVSIYDPHELERIMLAVKPDLVQAPLNVVDRRLETSGWLKRLRYEGIEIHTRSTFLQGLLLMPRHAIPAKFARWSSHWEAWHRYLQGRQSAATSMCLSYPLGLAEIDRIIVGVDSAEQLAAVLRASDPAASAEDLLFMASNDEELINPSLWESL